MTPGDEMTAAADKLRTLAAVATPGPWSQYGIGDYGWTVVTPESHVAETDDSDRGRADADWIAVMDPGVGSLLAQLLDVAAEHATDEAVAPAHIVRALLVARAINGQP